MKHWLFFLSDWLEKTSHAYHFTNIKRCIIYITYHITVTTNITCSPTKPTIHQKKENTIQKKNKKKTGTSSQTPSHDPPWYKLLLKLQTVSVTHYNQLNKFRPHSTACHHTPPHWNQKKKKTWISSNPSLIIILMKKTNKKTIPDHRQLVYTSHYFLHRVWK